MAWSDLSSGEKLQKAGSALSFAGGAFSSFAQASAQRQSASDLERQAALTKKQGNYVRVQMAREIQRTVGSQRALFANLGVEESGTALDIETETIENMSKDRAMTKYNYDMTELGYRKQARALRKAASKSKLGGIVNVAGTIASLAL